ncbi:MAG TPA: PEP-CTERM sorting domain-containing protein [Sedimentisphaerales bacterium]|nr:PEP-CTERM sorting domain-containing protein [Sedimentisphaerales bacterium]
MGKCKVFLTGIAVVVLFNSMAHGDLTSFTADAPHVFTPTGAIILLEVPSYTPSSVTITAVADAPFLISLAAVNNTALPWAACTLVSDLAGVAEFVPGSGQSTDFQNVTDIDAWTMLFEAPFEVAPGEFVTLEFRMEIPNTGPVTFTQTLTPVPVPEPATVVLLGLGGLALVAARKHA